MGLFDAFKTYEHEINEVREYLISEKGMRKEYANPFIAAYGKKLGKLVNEGRKKALDFNTSNPTGAELNKEFADHGIRFSVLGQAIRAYFEDLRRGQYVNSAVEVAIWGILINEDADLIDQIKPGLSNFVMENYKERVPAAKLVFVQDRKTSKLIPKNSAARKIAEEKFIADSTESQIEYIKEFEEFLNTIVAAALGTESSEQAEKFSCFLWPDICRNCGLAAGRKLGSPPKEAAMLTAIISGDIHLRTNKGSLDPVIKSANEMHYMINEFFQDYIDELQDTDLIDRFSDIFLEDFG